MFQVGTHVKPAAAISGKIGSKGTPAERIWLIAEKPLSKDQDKGFLFSSPMGWSYDKILQEVGITKYYTTLFETQTEALDNLNRYQPPIIVLLDSAGSIIIPQIRKKEDTRLWAGSLLKCDGLSYPHYCIPTFGPEVCVSDWTERQIVKFIDYGKIKDEYEYFNDYGFVRHLKHRRLDVDLHVANVIWYLETWLNDPRIEYISVDIETVYPREKSEFFGHPGYPVTVGIAISAEHGISFELFRETTTESIALWRALGALLLKKKVIGQNFFGFDEWILRMIGLPVERMNIIDTMYRHAVLWPELSHKLEFMTRQYTRQPYYKSEGHHWSPKDLERLKRYNALDCCVTYEVYEAQEEEFNERPHLR